MYKRILLTATLLSMGASGVCAADKKPKLIVQVTIDQFRADYMTRLAPAYSGGLKRLLEEGWGDGTGTVDHAITNSFPGHASLSTGAYPRTHGFPANEWWVFRDGKWTWLDGGADEDTTMVGAPGRSGVSPKNLRVTTLGEWVKAANPKAKAISLAASEIAVAYGGRISDGVYWYDPLQTSFSTSSFYRDALPVWLQAFNAKEMPAFRVEEWNSGVPEAMKALAAPDDRAFENDGQDTSFPHRFENVYDPASESSRDRQYAVWLAGTPQRDVAVLKAAQAAIAAERLGQRNVTDYLSVTLSATDSIGHSFGGKSQEALDAMMRIDRALGDLLGFLDATLGEEGYVLALAGDHGAPDAIEQTLADGGAARRVTGEELESLLDAVDEMGRQHKGSETELGQKIEAYLEAQPYIADAVTTAEVGGEKPSGNPYIEVYRHSWIKDRIPDFPLWTSKPNREHHPARYGIYVQFQENTYFHYASVVHGSPYAYDRTVPIVFFGGGVTPGRVDDLRTIDVAPSLAALAGIAVPATVDGRARRPQD